MLKLKHARYWLTKRKCAEQLNMPALVYGSFPNLSFKNDSIHSSKGKEADYVILLGLSKGKYGLPSEIVTHPLIEALQPKAEAYPHAE